MEKEPTALPPRPLPAIVDIYNDEALQTLKDAAAFQVLVNQPPSEKWIREHPFVKTESTNAKGEKIKVPLKYIPIERIEWLLSTVIVNFRVEIRSVMQIANSVCITIRLHYFDPVYNLWTFHDGVGAAPLQTDSGQGAANAQAIKSNAVQIGAPAAKSYAVKDAAEQIGKLFGKDLNRKEAISYDSLLGRFDKATEE